MNKIENLWPEDLGKINMTMPKEILLQQAIYLSEMTKNVVIAEIKSSQGVLNNTDEKVIIHEFNIKAPSMGNFQFTLLRAMHNFSIYPVKVFNALAENAVIANNEEEFVYALIDIFKSQQCRNAINSLIVQSIK